MKEARAPGGPAPRAIRSFAACLATVLEVDIAEVPAPVDGDVFRAWRHWLAGRGLGLAEAADGAALQWAGPSIARLVAREGDRPAVVRFGIPPGIVWDPLGRPRAAEDRVADAWLIAALDPLAPAAAAATTEPQAGTVDAIVLAAEAGAPSVLVDSARAEPGRGLEGDRHFSGLGTFSSPGAAGQDLTLVDAAVLAEVDVTAEEARRNVVTSGVDLDALIGRRFLVGEVECLGRRRCEPCARLERLTRRGVLRALVHQGGLRADVVGAGTIAVGDAVTPLA